MGSQPDPDHRMLRIMTSVLRQIAIRPWTLAAAAEWADAHLCWTASAIMSTAAATANGATHLRLRPTMPPAPGLDHDRDRGGACAAQDHEGDQEDERRHRNGPTTSGPRDPDEPERQHTHRELRGDVLVRERGAGGKAWGTKVQPPMPWPRPSTAMAAPAARAAAATGRKSAPRSLRWKSSM
jgi:hypothetical protein